MDTTSLNSEIGIMLFQTIPIRKSVYRVGDGTIRGKSICGKGDYRGKLMGYIYRGSNMGHGEEHTTKTSHHRQL